MQQNAPPKLGVLETSSYHICIGGVTLQFHDLHRDSNFFFPESLVPFCGPACKEGAEISVTAEFGDLSKFQPRGPCIIDSGYVWSLYREPNRYLFRFQTDYFGTIPYKIAYVNRSFTRVNVILHRPYFPPGRPAYPLEYPLDELLLIHYLASREGIEVHACGVRDSRGRGFLFPGTSGAGKSTMARLWLTRAAAQVLSDDRVVVRREGKGFRIYGTPWHGEAQLAAAETAHLEAIFFLRHGPRTRLFPVTGSQVVAELVRCTFAPFHFSWALEYILAFMERLVHTVPCYYLEFVPSPEIFEVLDGPVLD